MKKTKTIIMSITVLLLIAVIIFVARFVMSVVFSATEALNQLGNAPLETAQDEEMWVAPSMLPGDAYDLERGIDTTAADGDFSGDREPDVDADEELQSVPVEETADELAGTADDVTVD